MTLPIIAGSMSTVIFVVSYLPMLVKAVRTRDLSSYSLGSMMLANAGNVIHSIYVFNLPPGPLWALHSFYLVTTALMLLWYVRYTHRHKAEQNHAEVPAQRRMPSRWATRAASPRAGTSSLRRMFDT